MPFGPGNIATISIDSAEGGSLVDISSVTTSVKFMTKRKSIELPVIGGGQVNHLAGPVDASFAVSGWLDVTVAPYFTSYLADTTPTTRSVSNAPQGSGGPTRAAETMLSDYTETASSEEACTFDATLEVDGTVTYA